MRNDKQLKIRPVDHLTAAHWQLLLLADPSKTLVQHYLQAGRAFEAINADQLAAVMVLKENSAAELEIKNIAVEPRLENQGIATSLLSYAISWAESHHYQRVIIGTGSTSFKQLYLYQKLGFRITSIKKDFFVNNYQQPIHENGLLLRDMLLLTRKL